MAVSEIQPHDVQPARAGDWPWINPLYARLGGRVVASGGVLYTLRNHPTLVAGQAGATTLRDAGDAFEILAIAAGQAGVGVGTLLLGAVEQEARRMGRASIYVRTTNDNLDAHRFYQRRGFQISVYDVGGYADVLALKGLPPTPALGHYGIEIRDVVTFHRALG